MAGLTAIFYLVFVILSARCIYALSRKELRAKLKPWTGGDIVTAALIITFVGLVGHATLGGLIGGAIGILMADILMKTL